MDTDTKLYRIIETVRGRETANYVTLDKVAEIDNGDFHLVTCTEVMLESVTLAELSAVVDQELEKACHYDLVGMSEWVAGHLADNLPADQAKAILWGMIKDKGFCGNSSPLQNTLA